MLHKSGLVTKSVIAILSHTMEMGLVLTVVAAREPAILVESKVSRRTIKFFDNFYTIYTKQLGCRTVPESHVAFGNGLVFQHAHARLKSHLFLLRV